MPEQTGSLEQRVERLLALLDAMDVESLITMITDDVQSVDEISRGWSRGRAAVQSYLSQLTGSVSDVHSRMSDAHEAVWGDVGLVTFVLDQTYTIDGQQQTISAPTSIIFRRDQADWKIALIHTVPIPEAA
jgi:ketosteroid isomerase-like protein